MKEAIDTWRIHNRINLYLLNGIAEEHLACAATKGRTVGEQFAHLHNVRLMWLKAASPALLYGLEKLEKGATKDLLKQNFQKSGDAVAALLEEGFAAGKIKGFKPHASAFLGYLISHESHHRGQILLTLKQGGHAVDKKIQYGMWEWGSR